VGVARDDEERRARPAPCLERRDLGEAPVRVRAAQAMEGDRGEAAGLPQRLAPGSGTGVRAQPAGRVPDAAPRPAPGPVDVVRERDGEAGAAPARRRDPKALAQPFERRVERVEG
jgi:hypothetical protein